MGVFLLPDSGDAASVTKAALAYTRGDRFKALDGHRTFTSHYHVEHTEAFLNTARFQQSTGVPDGLRSEEHTSELQSLMRNSYAVFCLKKKKNNKRRTITTGKK